MLLDSGHRRHPAFIQRVMALQTPGLLFVVLLSCTAGIQLDGNGYTGVLFAINPSIPESPELLQRMKNMIQDASVVLYGAAENRFYFKEVTILVPANWTIGNYSRAKTETYEKANVIIDEPNKSYGDEPYTLQYGQCGVQGQYIHLTPDFLLDDRFIEVYGKRDKVFVHEWGHLRWGLYDEYSEEQPFYRSSKGTVEATRCSKEIQGRHGESECKLDATTGLPTSDCKFLPIKDAPVKESIMSFPFLDHVSKFCSDETHNAEAPNRQNQKCDNRAALDVILKSSVDAEIEQLSTPISKQNTTIKFVQRKRRVVCLTLDVSGSMNGPRIALLRQAATLFLRTTVEDTAVVGIVQFSSSPSILKTLTVIDGEQSREELVEVLPTTANGGTNICPGIDKAFEVLKGDDGSTEGDELVLLTDGEASDNLNDCRDRVMSSGARVHTIALGPSADKKLQDFANFTDGIFHKSADSIDSNALTDAFASLAPSDGILAQQTIQLESAGKRTTDWFNGTFSVDWTVGKDTVITIVYEASMPKLHITSPGGPSFSESRFDHDTKIRTLSFKVQGIAKTGEWHYSLFNQGPSAQSMAITVTSHAANADVAPITVKAHMNQKSADGSKAMVVYAAVTQNRLPVIRASVMATLESDNGHKEELSLLDNGAGADAFRDDGIYSRYFTKLNSGRYSLKVRVQNQDNGMLSAHKHSGVPYMSGYVENGTVVLNPPKPPVSQQPIEVGSFTRTATGESFVVELPPGSTGPPAFPPSKITDLRATLEGENITITWTAPGESYDQGTASRYHIGWSEDLALLRSNFNDSHLVDPWELKPQETSQSISWTSACINRFCHTTTCIRSLSHLSTKAQML
ncbi:hypothetical protein ACEWY4_014220 [Coilia grayii]|uniref:VWFA domain-containing protein n=1 Tax=Coilia grayii TaxID=363190 RepID=A0ABD1JRN0_9TELE